MKQGERDSKKRIAFPIRLFEEGPPFAELPDQTHVVSTGKWDHPVYGEMEITSANVAEFVQNFKDKVRKDLPIIAGHDSDFGMPPIDGFSSSSCSIATQMPLQFKWKRLF